MSFRSDLKYPKYCEKKHRLFNNNIYNLHRQTDWQTNRLTFKKPYSTQYRIKGMR